MVYLDYDVSAAAGASGGLVTISGFASNGSTRANFSLKNTVSQNASGGLVLSLDYDVTVPSRKVALNWTATFANISETEVAVTLDLGVAGPNGDVRIVGTYGASGGTFTVKVNGDLFATVTLEGSSPVITGAGGNPLTAEEEQTLADHSRLLRHLDRRVHRAADAGELSRAGADVRRPGRDRPGLRVCGLVSGGAVQGWGPGLRTSRQCSARPTPRTAPAERRDPGEARTWCGS